MTIKAWWEWWEKSNLVMRFMNNLTIWREILTFDGKKYIRNGGKCDFFSRKNAFFQALQQEGWSKVWNKVVSEFRLFRFGQVPKVVLSHKLLPQKFLCCINNIQIILRYTWWVSRTPGPAEQVNKIRSKVIYRLSFNWVNCYDYLD